MATFKWGGNEEYLKKIAELYAKDQSMIKMAVYEGAKIMADAVRSAIEEHKDTGDLAESMSLANMINDNGYINTKVMFAGYDRKGTPNAIKAAVLESGTSDGKHPKLRVLSRAARGCTQKAYAAMSAKIDELISQIMEG